jgi:phosphonate transport system substrate-binding protein
MKFTTFRKQILIPLLMLFEILLGIIISLLVSKISNNKKIFENINISLNLSQIIIMLLGVLFIICCILVLVKYLQKQEENKTNKADISSDESVVSATQDSKSKDKFPRRKVIASIGLVFAGFAVAFIVQAIWNNPGNRPNIQSSPTPEPTPTPIDIIKFASLPTIDFKTQQEKENWDNFIQDMEQKLGIPVSIFSVQSYEGVINAINNGEAQIAWFGGKSYVEAANKNKIEAFAQTVNDDGSRGYYSYLIANKDNPISQVNTPGIKQTDKSIVDAIKQDSQLTFAFNDQNSTSGFLVPNLCVFAKNGIESKTAFSNPPSFLGNHEATALAVTNENVDIATNNSEALVRLKASNPKAYEQIKVIWQSRIIPSDPIAYRKDLPENLKTNIRDFFYSYQNKQVLKILGWSKFEKASDSTWNIIRELDNIAEQVKNGISNSQLQAEAKSICLP